MNWRTELQTSSTSPKSRTSQDLVEFLRDAKPADRKIWLATLTSKEKQTVLAVLDQVQKNPWSQYANDPSASSKGALENRFGLNSAKSLNL
jgi:hypothetical protein